MNARQNPFSTRRIEERLVFDPALIGTGWETILEKWQALGERACVVGPHGAGKTTFLDAFANRIEGPVVRFFFNQTSQRIEGSDLERMSAGEGAVWVVDGDRHLSMRDRHRFYQAARQARGFLSARHCSCRFPVLLKLAPDDGLAKRLFSKIDPGNQFGLQGELEAMCRKRRHNLREVWLDCYDRAARSAVD